MVIAYAKHLRVTFKVRYTNTIQELSSLCEVDLKYLHISGFPFDDMEI